MTGLIGVRSFQLQIFPDFRTWWWKGENANEQREHGN